MEGRATRCSTNPQKCFTITITKKEKYIKIDFERKRIWKIKKQKNSWLKQNEIENMIIISIEIYFCDIVSDVEVRLLKLKET